MSFGSACGKIILFGEHAVVYGRPALAVPLRELRTRVRVKARREPGLVLHALDLRREIMLENAPEAEPLAAITRLVLADIGAPASPALDVWIESDVPVASGLGSGAAVSTAIVRALGAYFGKEFDEDVISHLVLQTERLYHGTPSGIDNTVIALERPIRFTIERGAQPIRIARPFTLAIADSGLASPTRITVGDVRQAWQRAPVRYEALFDEIAAVVEHAQRALESGQTRELGPLMQRNQELLRALDVSSPEIETLLDVAVKAGASGGKLSGGGRGGNVIVAMDSDRAGSIRRALLEAGAARVIVTTVAES